MAPRICPNTPRRVLKQYLTGYATQQLTVSAGARFHNQTLTQS